MASSLSIHSRFSVNPNLPSQELFLDETQRGIDSELLATPSGQRTLHVPEDFFFVTPWEVGSKQRC